MEQLNISFYSLYNICGIVSSFQIDLLEKLTLFLQVCFVTKPMNDFFVLKNGVCLFDSIRYFETEQVILQNNLERVAVFHMVVE